MDCVRTVLRLGAERSVMTYRRAIQEIPVDEIELEEAEIEGIDDNEHAESAYDFTTLRSFGGGGAGTPRPDAATTQAAEHIPAHASKEG